MVMLIILLAPEVSAFEAGGRISVKPPYPAPAVIKVDEKHAESCGPEQVSPAFLVSAEGGVGNAVVWLEGKNLKAGAVHEPLLLRQKNCRFEPHILIVPAGAPFQVTNEDPMVHDVRIFDGAVMLERFEMDEKGEPEERRLENPGRYLIRCGFHKWMHAYVIHAPHGHYAVTDSQGRFRLQDVPPGRYTLHIWHERLGEAAQPLDLRVDTAGIEHVFERV